MCCWLLQASTDPEYQALLAKQQGLDALTATQIAAGLLSQQQKEAGLASVFKRDDENLARRCVPLLGSTPMRPAKSMLRRAQHAFLLNR